MYECPSRLRESKGNDMNRPIHRLGRAIKEVWFGRSRVRDEEGLSIWTVLGGILLSSFLVSLFIIPNLLGARTAAQNGAAEHNLQAGLTDVKTYFTGDNSYIGITAPGMDVVDPILTFTTGSSTGPKNVSIARSASGSSIEMAAKSATGACFYISDVERLSTNHSASGDFYAAVSSPASCSASSAPTSGLVRNGFPLPS
jgi:hypothetical protein